MIWTYVTFPCPLVVDSRSPEEMVVHSHSSFTHEPLDSCKSPSLQLLMKGREMLSGSHYLLRLERTYNTVRNLTALFYSLVVINSTLLKTYSLKASDILYHHCVPLHDCFNVCLHVDAGRYCFNYSLPSCVIPGSASARIAVTGTYVH